MQENCAQTLRSKVPCQPEKKHKEEKKRPALEGLSDGSETFYLVMLLPAKGANQCVPTVKAPFRV